MRGGVHLFTCPWLRAVLMPELPTFLIRRLTGFLGWVLRQDLAWVAGVRAWGHAWCFPDALAFSIPMPVPSLLAQKVRALGPP